MIPSNPFLLRATTAGALLLACGSILLARGSGAISGSFGMPSKLSSAYPSCGNCHAQFPNSNGVVKVAIQTARSIPVGTSSPVTVTLSGGVTSSSRGGFNMETDQGSFVAGMNSQISSSGTEVTHSDSLSRSWTFAFTSKTVGLHQWTAVGNTVDGNGRNTGDSWGFYGPDSALPGEVFRVFVNDASVTAYGSSCAGDQGYQSLLGMPKAATVGGTFTTELYDVPQGAVSLGIFGLFRTQFGALPLPFDLGVLGMPGCSLYASMDILQPALTTGAPGPGSGKATFPWALPQLPVLKGFTIYLQALTLDPKANSFGMTASHALAAKIQ